MVLRMSRLTRCPRNFARSFVPVRFAFVASLALLLILCERSLVPAQSNGTAPSRRSHSTRSGTASARLAVDVVKLKSGQTLRGTVARMEPDGSITLALEREWLRKANPALLATTEAEEARTRTAALEQLRDRLQHELTKTPADSGLATFLRVEQKRIAGLLANAAAGSRESAPPQSGSTHSTRPQFVFVELPKKKIARITPASIAHKQIAGWSWYERLPHVESRDAEELARELQHRHIDPTQPLPDMSDRLPLRLQDEREWSARIAIVSSALGKPLEFQGTGDLLVRADHAKNADDLAPLIAKMFGGQVDSLFKDLLNEGRATAATPQSSNAWLEPAIREAEKEKARAFRATRVDLSLERHQATVNSVFVVQLANGKWETIWSDHAVEDGSQARPAAEANITGDPQIKSALALLKSLGAGGDDQVGAAIRMGAATMAAQQTVNNHFAAFETPFLRQLDGPPLSWGQ